MKKPNNEIISSSRTQIIESEKDHELSPSSSEEDESEIERELADVTFEELQKAKSDGTQSVCRRRNQEEKPGRANKNRPMEASCKKPVSRFREVVQAPKKVVCDPRFETLCGKLDVEGFRKRDDFLFKDILPSEREDKQLKFESANQSDAAILAEHKMKEREAAKQGKKPFYLKKLEVRKQRLIKKYNKLKESGKLESFMQKWRKKNAAKDHRFVPYRRSSNNENS